MVPMMAVFLESGPILSRKSRLKPIAGPRPPPKPPLPEPPALPLLELSPVEPLPALPALALPAESPAEAVGPPKPSVFMPEARRASSSWSKPDAIHFSLKLMRPQFARIN